LTTFALLSATAPQKIIEEEKVTYTEKPKEEQVAYTPPIPTIQWERGETKDNNFVDQFPV